MIFLKTIHWQKCQFTCILVEKTNKPFTTSTLHTYKLYSSKLPPHRKDKQTALSLIGFYSNKFTHKYTVSHLDGTRLEFFPRAFKHKPLRTKSAKNHAGPTVKNMSVHSCVWECTHMWSECLLFCVLSRFDDWKWVEIPYKFVNVFTWFMCYQKDCGDSGLHFDVNFVYMLVMECD
jgi:hypothetical protein